MWPTNHKDFHQDQLCPTRGPGEGFVRPSLGFRCSSSNGTMGNCFIWRSQQAEALQGAIALSQPTNSEH